MLKLQARGNQSRSEKRGRGTTSTPKNSPAKLSNRPRPRPSPSSFSARRRKLETPPRNRRFRPALRHIRASIKFVKATNRCYRAQDWRNGAGREVGVRPSPPKFPRHTATIDIRLRLAYHEVCLERNFQRRLQGPTTVAKAIHLRVAELKRIGASSLRFTVNRIRVYQSLIHLILETSVNASRVCNAPLLAEPLYAFVYEILCDLIDYYSIIYAYGWILTNTRILSNTRVRSFFGFSLPQTKYRIRIFIVIYAYNIER